MFEDAGIGILDTVINKVHWIEKGYTGPKTNKKKRDNYDKILHIPL